jgi:ribosome biogenesis GTPase A
MNKARKDITLALQQVDAVIEIVDARLPYSSENPLLNKLIGAKPRLRLLSKADLADPHVSNQWVSFYQEQNLDCLLFHKDDIGSLRRILPSLVSQVARMNSRATRIMIVGIPNVGKSTLINMLADRKLAKVGNEPAVTKARQEIRLSEDLVLLDTPGMLWPKLDDQVAAYRLAISGAIRNTAIDLADVGLQAVTFLQQRYPGALQKRYQIATEGVEPTRLLEEIGIKRGCLVRGGVEFTKAGEVVLNDLRTGKLGRLSLETPADIPPPAPAESETANVPD